jgi:hypothetical protein
MPVGTGGTVRVYFSATLNRKIDAKIILGIHTIFICVRVLRSSDRQEACTALFHGSGPYLPTAEVTRFFLLQETGN